MQLHCGSLSIQATPPQRLITPNKNRLCSKTWGVDSDIEDKKDQAKKRDYSHRRNYKYTKKNEWINGREDIFLKKTLDPTPKKHLVWKRWIPPRRKIKVGDKGERTATKVDLDLRSTFKVMTSK